MTRNTRPGFLSLALFGLIGFAIMALAVLLSSAMEAGGWMFIAFIIGLIIVCGVIAWVISFVVRQYVQWTEAHTKAQETNNNFVLAMAKIGYLPSGGKFKPADQLPAPEKSQKPIEIDPRHDLLVALCLATIRADGYGPASERLLTADDAQSRGGKFADRNNWASASEYGQSIGMLYTKIGGKDQGLKVNGVGAGGRTVTDLLEALHSRNSICDSAVAALPGVVR